MTIPKCVFPAIALIALGGSSAQALIVTSANASGQLPVSSLEQHPELQLPRITTVTTAYDNLREPPVPPYTRIDSGTFESWVAMEPSGMLDFFYRANVTSGVSPEHIIIPNIDTNYFVDIGVLGGTTELTDYLRYYNGENRLGFQTDHDHHLDGIYYIRTNASSYTQASVVFNFPTIGWGGLALVPTGSPTGVPEPATLMLMAVPMAALAGKWRRAGR